jgi:glucose/mannose transport system substrate-binding protein
MSDDSGRRFSRRRYLSGAGTVGAALLAGGRGAGGGSASTDDDPDIVEDEESDEETDTPTATESPTRTATRDPDGELQVAHFWRAGDGNDAITALFAGFRERYPEVEVDTDMVRGGGSPSLRDEIRARIENGDPPSTWQTWPGGTLQPLAEDGLLRDIEAPVWDENDMRAAYPEDVRGVAAPAGDLVTVPLSVHRINNLFYNVDVVESAGVEPQALSTPRDLLDALDAVATETDAVPMAQATAGPWTTVQLWETVLLGEHGQDAYDAVTAGEVDRVAAEVEDALALVADYEPYFSPAAASVAFTEANQQVIEGEAAFIHQGDWAASAYRDTEDFAFGTDWNGVPFPGTDGLYALTADSFPYPVNNPSPDATTTFLRYCGSVEGQARFNPPKGSIPPRTDVPTDRFAPFPTRQMRHYEAADSHPPSIMHGLAVGPGTRSAIVDAFAGFTADWEVDGVTDEIREAF